jgi:ribosome biogenesis GTPase / thiamine phosphate phosphatase
LTTFSSSLSALGWSPRWQTLRGEVSEAGAFPGRVIHRDRGFATISTGDDVLTFALPDRLGQLVTGDWVAIGADGISEMMPRKGALRRRGPDGVEQILAANLDVVLLVCGIDRPVKAGRIQRGAIQAWDAGASPTVILNKADLGSTAELRSDIEQETPGLDVIEVSTVTGAGLDLVRKAVGGRTVVLLGESGAGKSSLMNALAGENLAGIAAVRASDSKGRHTTTRRELHVVPGTGIVIDTPGTREFGLAAEQASIDAAFSDIEEIALACRFYDCRHDTEPGCAVRAAIESGALSAKRLESFKRLQREVDSEILRANPHERRRYERRFAKVVKDAVRIKRGEEP